MAGVMLKSVATVTSTDVEDAPNGGFEAIASTPDLDRDGDVLSRDSWKSLPDRVTIDVDHSMDVRGTIGSAKPYFDNSGNLCISAKFASTPLAQEVRALMTEGHVDSVSVAFMSDTVKNAGGESRTERELLNVGVVAIPSNRAAKVLAAKGFDLKSGARNNQQDAAQVQAIHNATMALGAQCADGADDTGDDEGENSKSLSLRDATAVLKSLDLTTLPLNVRAAIELLVASDASEETSSKSVEPAAAVDETAAADEMTLRAKALELSVNLLSM